MPPKMCPGTFHLTKNKMARTFKECFRQGGPREAQGQAPSKMCPGTFVYLKLYGPEHLRDVSGRDGPGGPGPDAFKKIPWNIFIDQNQRGHNVLGMFLAGGARGAQDQMPSKMLSEVFFPLKPKGPEHFRDVSGRGGPGSQGQTPSKRKPDFS